MVLWIGFAVLAAAVVWAVTRPLLDPDQSATPGNDREIAVYRDQLTEIEAEREQGLLGPAEAEGARIELARRLIRHAEEAKAAGAAPRSGLAQQAVIYAAAAIPVVGIGIYLTVGSPQLPARPYATRLEAPIDQATAGDLVARVEAHLRANPEDGRGWDVLAPVYLRTGDTAAAADAFQRAMRLLGESPKRLAGFARATIMAQDGIVSEPARQAYARLLALDAKAIEPQVWLAIAREQDGDLVGAMGEYRRLLGEAKDPWTDLLGERLRAVTARLRGGNATAPGAPAGPGASPPAAAPPGDAAAGVAAMAPGDRAKFIGQMVDGLAARLKENGNDLEGWMRLVRSYVVLGRREDAAGALASARGHFSGDEKSLAQLHELAESLGLGS
ncbi:MAG: c-type cytochrome biogenesis protein CcmI [Hyphomicrobium sp.]